MWRGRRFADDTEQGKLQALSNAIDDAAGHTAEDHGTVAYTVVPKGIPGADLDKSRHQLLLSLLSTYLGRVPDSISPMAGSTEPGRPHYYRIQPPPRLLIEWDNTQRGANHEHSVWRDPEADFGLEVLARHRARSH